MVVALQTLFNSGRLPYTIGKNIDDYSAQIVTNSNGAIAQVLYTEGLMVDYRHFDAVSAFWGAVSYLKMM